MCGLKDHSKWPERTKSSNSGNRTTYSVQGVGEIKNNMNSSNRTTFEWSKKSVNHKTIFRWSEQRQYQISVFSQRGQPEMNVTENWLEEGNCTICSDGAGTVCWKVAKSRVPKCPQLARPQEGGNVESVAESLTSVIIYKQVVGYQSHEGQQLITQDLRGSPWWTEAVVGERQTDRSCRERVWV